MKLNDIMIANEDYANEMLEKQNYTYKINDGIYFDDRCTCETGCGVGEAVLQHAVE